MSIRDYINNLWKDRKHEEIMATLKDVIDSLDSLKQQAQAIDLGVEALFDQIKQQSGDGISSEVADTLLAKISEIRQAASLILTDE